MLVGLPELLELRVEAKGRLSGVGHNFESNVWDIWGFRVRKIWGFGDQDHSWFGVSGCFPFFVWLEIVL